MSFQLATMDQSASVHIWVWFYNFMENIIGIILTIFY